jgi:OmpR-family two-component system manganese-sensing sensor histidine kinase
MFQATRRRLAIWYAIVTAVVLLVFASGVFFYVRSTLIERIDDTLDHVVEVVRRSIAIDRHGQIDVAESFHNNFADLEDDHIDLELFDLQDKLLWSTWPEPLRAPLHHNANGKTIAIDPEHLLRQVTQPIRFHQQTLGWLRVSHPWFEVTKPSQLLFIDLLVGTSLMMVAVSAVGWFLSGLAMEPIKASYQQLKQFTADASHELRNPLATIQTNVQVALATNAQLPTEQRQQWQVIERLTRRLGRLVDDLLFLARQDSNTPIKTEQIPLDALLLEVMEEQELAATAKGISLQIEIADHPIEFNVMGDWDELARLFTNLITNAIHYTPTQSENQAQTNQTQTNQTQTVITIHLQAIPKSSPLILQVQVQDRGIGIAEADLPRLLDRFYRVYPARSTAESGSTGSGLGLSIVQAIVHRYQGDLSIDSKVNVGTTVTVKLPAHTD